MFRRLIALLLCLFLLSFLLTGCGTETAAEEAAAEPGTLEETGEAAPENTGEEAVSEEAQRTGSLGVAWQSTEGLHPYTSTSVTNQVIFSLLYESLFVVTDSFTAEPVLCEASSVSEDGTVWHFDLKQNITFSDGSAMTASDVVTSLKAAAGSAMYQNRFADVTSIEQDGTLGIVIRLDTAYENLPLLLDIPIVKASTVSSESPTGSGPYVRDGSVLRRNSSWWQDAAPVLDAQELTLIAAEDPLEVRNAFEFGGADVAYTDPCASTLAAYHSDNERWGCPTTVMLYIGFNQNSNYFYSSTLRSGITYATDRDSIVADIYGGFGLAASLPCSPLSAVYDSALASSYTFNPGSFQACLQSSGIIPDSSDPVSLVVSNENPKRVQTANLIAGQLTELGLYTEVESLEDDEFQYALASGNFDLYLSEIRLSPTFDLSCFFTYGGSAWFGGSDSESLLQLCNAALENSGNYYDLFRTVMVRGLICPIMFRVNALYATRGVLSNCTPALSTLLYCNSGVTAADILSETAYEVSDLPADPLEDEAIPLPGEEQENSGGISETGSDPDSQTGNDGQLPEEQPSEEPDSQNPDGEVSGETPEDALEGEPSTPETLPDGTSGAASGQTDLLSQEPSNLP